MGLQEFERKSVPATKYMSVQKFQEEGAQENEAWHEVFQSQSELWEHYRLNRLHEFQGTRNAYRLISI